MKKVTTRQKIEDITAKYILSDILDEWQKEELRLALQAAYRAGQKSVKNQIEDIFTEANAKK